ncbi:MAG: hypothetical protein QM723_36965 [Myxococcaceae bacterium]
MLDAFIIEELRRRERERQQRERERPQLEIPRDDDGDRDQKNDRRSDKRDQPARGVVVIDL